MAQVSEGFSYQSVVRDASGNLLYNQLIGLRMTLLANSALGTADYVETHQVATNGYGVVSISVGTGTVVSGVFNNVDWINNTYFLKTELDVSGGTNYVFMGISQILAVPYALHAQTASSVLGDNDTSATNEIQQLSIVGNQLVLDNGGNSVTLSGTIDLDADPTNELQALNISNDTLYLSQGNYVLIDDYLQSLSNTAGTISISGNNSITLADSSSTNEIQQLSIAGNDITISDANTITLPTNNDNDPVNELQNLSNTAGTISISNGNTITLQDSSSVNELQSLFISGNDISITSSNTITIPTNNDNDPINEIQNLNLSGNDISISGGNTITIPADGDDNSFNELQLLSYNNTTLTISSGNSIDLHPHYVGELYAGGVVFYVDHTGHHGLIASLNNLSNNTSTPTSNLVCNSWDGATNTAILINSGFSATSAPGLCDAFSYGGYNDWYLPSILELVYLFNNSFIVNKTLTQQTGSNLFEGSGWQSGWPPTYASSSCICNGSSIDGLGLNYLDGIRAGGSVGTTSVRAIRAF